MRTALVRRRAAAAVLAFVALGTAALLTGGCHIEGPASDKPRYWEEKVAAAAPGRTTRAELEALLPSGAAGASGPGVPGTYVRVYEVSQHFAVRAVFEHAGYEPGDAGEPSDVLADDPVVFRTGSY